MGPCPNCTGKGNQGDGACDRCTGTGNVRYYEDGFVGEERSRMHPKEKELAAKPKCVGCGREVDPVWVACPICGQKLDAPMQPEKIDDPLFTGQAL
jgi:predicted amidophosphoribosyltransferase